MVGNGRDRGGLTDRSVLEGKGGGVGGNRAAELAADGRRELLDIMILIMKALGLYEDR